MSRERLLRGILQIVLHHVRCPPVVHVCGFVASLTTNSAVMGHVENVKIQDKSNSGCLHDNAYQVG